MSFKGEIDTGIDTDVDMDVDSDMGGCQNYGPLSGPLNTRCRTILRTQKGTIILTTTHMLFEQIGGVVFLNTSFNPVRSRVERP